MMILGTRRSQLATTQSGLVAEALRAEGHKIAVQTIVTEGDVKTGSLASMGGTGVFAAALRQALRDGEIDFAVHSLKDLPVAAEEGLVLAAIPQRERPFDVVCARDGLQLVDLPPGARVGTGSPRRAAQIAALNLGVEIVDIRGNVETRLGKVASGELDAVVLAYAGLSRLGITEVITDSLDYSQMIPAAGQGALAIECRQEDARVLQALQALDHGASRAEITAERAVLATLQVGCAAPVGVIAHSDEAQGLVEVSAFVGDAASGHDLRYSVSGSIGKAHDLGVAVGLKLLDQGAAELIDSSAREG